MSVSTPADKRLVKGPGMLQRKEGSVPLGTEPSAKSRSLAAKV
jgi:hypothetical protein